MSNYFIGDVHGCYKSLQTILNQIHFNPNIDTLYFTGDLVSRGPNSLEVLRFIKSLKNSAYTVLGNHDLHLLNTNFKINNYQFSEHPFNSILQAPDSDELICWLHQQPILHIDKNKKILMVHAGIHPNWNIFHTQKYAKEIEILLKSEHAGILFQKPCIHTTNMHLVIKIKKLKKIQNNVNIFTKMRYIDSNGELNMQYKNDPKHAPKNIFPWFNVPTLIAPAYSIIFGHWASLKHRKISPKIYGLDSGCCWGGALTALRWEDKKIIQIPCSSVT